MAVTNHTIILNQQIELLKAGKIKATGRVLTMQDAEGNEVQFQEPEAIHTFQKWKALGFKVKKGERAIARFPIWKYSNNSKEEEEENGRGYCYMKNSCFFSQSQVEKA